MSGAQSAEPLEDALARLLAERGLSLAVAESCTGGLLAKRLTDRPGASDFFIAGLVTYSDESKRTLLGVNAASLDAHGAVSEEVASEMALGARRATGADVAAAITGVAGPGGGTAAKPVGTVWVAAAMGNRLETRLHRIAGERGDVRDRSARAALALLWEMLTEGEA